MWAKRENFPGVLVDMAAVAICLCVMAWPLGDWLDAGLRVMPDSAAYLECAKSLAEGRGFVTGQYDSLDPTRWAPLQLWPPGYPVAVACLVKFGCAPYVAGLSVSVGCAIIFVVILTLVLRRRFGGAVGIPLSCAILSMAPLLKAMTLCMSESLYMVLALGAFLCLAKPGQWDRKSVVWVLASGLCAGAAWTVRSVGISVFAACVGYMMLMAPRRMWKATFKTCMWWTIGCCTGASWLLARNLITFGKLNPYSMPSSEFSLQHNIARTVLTVVNDMLSNGLVINSISRQSVATFSCAVAGAGIVFWYLWKRGTLKIQWLQQDRLTLLLGLYAVLYVMVIIAARTKYHLGSEINSRYMCPIYWVIWFIGVGVLMDLIGWGNGNNRRAVVLGCVLALAAVAYAYTSDIAADQSRITRHSSPSMAKVIERLGRDVPPGMIVLSDRAYFLRCIGGINGRQLPRTEGVDSYSRPISLQSIKEAGRAGILYGICLTGSPDPSPYSEDIQTIFSGKHAEAGFERMELGEDLVLFRWKAK